ncbi:IMP cyclohydrolase [Paenibacillus harenae]|uniref:IMP cyclohydrolase n=1 Tax=Paenibacillus harenae TaxID=306543 RepID=UPI0004271B47|nr:IMP cyclohydrolase [Paenibacillus harenae]
MNHRLLNENWLKLKENVYPGRGIVIGMTPSRQHYVQVYWIMGRSENSRNRVFAREGDFVKNKAFDETKMTDPSLIIYYPLKKTGPYHIVSNGDQTETIMDGLMNNQTFESSLFTREYEPDAPHFTPRISGVIDTAQQNYKLSILKSSRNRPEICVRNFFNFNRFVPGEGHCIHTYQDEADGTLLSFYGEPFEVSLFDDIEEVKDYYWQTLNPENRISLLVKFIDAISAEERISIINKR